MRPKKTRWVKCLPGERCFRPQGRKALAPQDVYLTVDEFETLRLSDLEGLTHAQAAGLMQVSRPTFTRILMAAHRKVADGLVNIKSIRIEGGCCRIGTASPQGRP